jgi:MraZ protein
MPGPDANLPVFHGEFRYGVDPARRVMIPKIWRPTDPKVIFTAVLWPIAVESYLLVLPPERWQTVLDKVKSGRLTDERAAKLERTLATTSAPLLLDKVGRFCLPENLAEAAAITKEAQFVGRLTQFEIWSPRRYQAALTVDKEEAARTAVEAGL